MQRRAIVGIRGIRESRPHRPRHRVLHRCATIWVALTLSPGHGASGGPFPITDSPSLSSATAPISLARLIMHYARMSQKCKRIPRRNCVRLGTFIEGFHILVCDRCHDHGESTFHGLSACSAPSWHKSAPARRLAAQMHRHALRRCLAISRPARKFCHRRHRASRVSRGAGLKGDRRRAAPVPSAR
jgi:hypothetical protein